jgi:hypothetical protein
MAFLPYLESRDIFSLPIEVLSILQDILVVALNDKWECKDSCEPSLQVIGGARFLCMLRKEASG